VYRWFHSQTWPTIAPWAALKALGREPLEEPLVWGVPGAAVVGLRAGDSTVEVLR
jgi:hypothetical protein